MVLLSLCPHSHGDGQLSHQGSALGHTLHGFSSPKMIVCSGDTTVIARISARKMSLWNLQGF